MKQELMQTGTATSETSKDYSTNPMLFLLCSIPIQLQMLPVKTYFTPKILSTCPLLLGHCRQFQNLSITFYLSLTEGIV